MARRRSRSRRRLQVSAIGLSIALLGLVAAPAAVSQDRGRCATTELPGYLVLPDGSVRDPGSISICFERWLSPVTGLHSIRVNGEAWGMLISRKGADETRDSERPIVVFTRPDRHGHVRLIGYAWPARAGMVTHVLHQPGRSKVSQLADADRLLAETTSEEFVLVAARID